MRMWTWDGSRTRLEKAGERPWDEQADIRIVSFELNKELLSVLTPAVSEEEGPAMGLFFLLALIE